MKNAESEHSPLLVAYGSTGLQLAKHKLRTSEKPLLIKMRKLVSFFPAGPAQVLCLQTKCHVVCTGHLHTRESSLNSYFVGENFHVAFPLIDFG